MTVMDLPSVQTALCLSQKGMADEISRFFCSCDLDLNAMTLIYKSDLCPLMTRPHVKPELSMSKLSKVKSVKDRKRITTAAFVGVKNAVDRQPGHIKALTETHRIYI